MKKKTYIALIDDKSYGLEQIHNRHLGENYVLEYFSTFREFQEKQQHFDIVYLDYYLEKDGITADVVLPTVQILAEKVIAFSSVQSKCDELVKAGADFAVRKL